eukprot:gene19138-6439_t
MDNHSTNKCKLCIPLIELVVNAGWYQKIEIKFLLPGHSHDAGDQMHSAVASRYWSRDQFGSKAITDMLSIMNIRHLWMTHLVEITDWLSAGGVTNTSNLDGISTAYGIRVTPQGSQVRGLCSEDWTPQVPHRFLKNLPRKYTFKKVESKRPGEKEIEIMKRLVGYVDAGTPRDTVMSEIESWERPVDCLYGARLQRAFETVIEDNMKKAEEEKKLNEILQKEKQASTCKMFPQNNSAAAAQDEPVKKRAKNDAKSNK